MLLLNGSDINKSFSGETLFENVSFNVYDKDKIGFVGVNGAGKSTLFKIITGEVEYDSGDLSKSREAKIGYLEQHPVSESTRTVMEEILTVFSEVTAVEEQLAGVQSDLENHNGDMNALISRQAALQERFMALDGTHYQSKIRSVLTGLGFSEDVFDMPRGNLSGGQKTRIALCKILLSDTNLLLLDEPTNHLDIDSVEWLEEFLDNYKGAFIVISHDRYFINKLADRILYLTHDGITAFDGNYDDYLENRQQLRAAEKPEEKAEEKGRDYKERKRQEAEKRKILNRYAKVEELIDTTGKKITELETAYDDPGIASDYEKLGEISGQIDALKGELDGLMEEWESLQMAIDEGI